MMRLFPDWFQPLSFPPSPFRFPFDTGLCYNRRAVEHPAKQLLAPVPPSAAQAPAPDSESPRTALNEPVRLEDASRFCPVCSQRLESRRCKLVCFVCGYYMSCADYY